MYSVLLNLDMYFLCMAGYRLKFQVLQEYCLFPVSLFNSSLFLFKTPVSRPFTEPNRQQAAAVRQNVQPQLHLFCS